MESDATEAIDGAGAAAEIVVSSAYKEVSAMFEGLGAAVPNIAIAALVLIFFYVLARFAGWSVGRATEMRAGDNLGRVLGNLAFYGVFLFGLLSAATVVFPSVEPVDVISTLGIGSVAIGFAFKDILQNWLAGLLILLRRPFKPGDWIEVEGEVGEVEEIETRATMLRTFDGKRVVIPNTNVFTDSVKVLTAYPQRRTQYDVGVGYGDDIDEAKQIVMDAVRSVEGVAETPEPAVYTWGLEASWVTLRVMWWTDSRGAMGPRDKVITAIKKALDKAGIDMPFETQVHLFHNQTDEHDGDRGMQREGWPSRGSSPRPVRLIDGSKRGGEGESEHIAAE